MNLWKKTREPEKKAPISRNEARAQQVSEDTVKSSDPKKAIENYLIRHAELHLATVTSEGRPMAHTMAYVSEGPVVWIFTSPRSRKVENMRANPAVAYTVYCAPGGVAGLTGVQMEGVAEFVTDRETVDRVMKLAFTKYPELAAMGMSPDMLAIIRIDPTHGYFLDYNVSFGYRAEVTY